MAARQPFPAPPSAGSAQKATHGHVLLDEAMQFQKGPSSAAARRGGTEAGKAMGAAPTLRPTPASLPIGTPSSRTGPVGAAVGSRATGQGGGPVGAAPSPSSSSSTSTRHSAGSGSTTATSTNNKIFKSNGKAGSAIGSSSPTYVQTSDVKNKEDAFHTERPRDTSPAALTVNKAGYFPRPRTAGPYPVPLPQAGSVATPGRQLTDQSPSPRPPNRFSATSADKVGPAPFPRPRAASPQVQVPRPASAAHPAALAAASAAVASGTTVARSVSPAAPSSAGAPARSPSPAASPLAGGVQVKNTFIHFDVPSSPTSAVLQTENVWNTSPDVMLEKSFHTKYPNMEIAHIRGECKPCAYHVYKTDGCRHGDACPFCHLCTRGEIKRRKKEKAKTLKTQGAPEGTSSPYDGSSPSGGLSPSDGHRSPVVPGALSPNGYRSPVGRALSPTARSPSPNFRPLTAVVGPPRMAPNLQGLPDMLANLNNLNYRTGPPAYMAGMAPMGVAPTAYRAR